MSQGLQPALVPDPGATEKKDMVPAFEESMRRPAVKRKADQ